MVHFRERLGFPDVLIGERKKLTLGLYMGICTKIYSALVWGSNLNATYKHFFILTTRYLSHCFLVSKVLTKPTTLSIGRSITPRPIKLQREKKIGVWSQPLRV